jgi:hypothetical protein
MANPFVGRQPTQSGWLLHSPILPGAGFDHHDDAIPFGIACFRSIVEHGVPL